MSETAGITVEIKRIDVNILSQVTVETHRKERVGYWLLAEFCGHYYIVYLLKRKDAMTQVLLTVEHAVVSAESDAVSGGAFLLVF